MGLSTIGYRAAGTTLIRAAAVPRSQLAVPAWPQGTPSGEDWTSWLRKCWSTPEIADPVGHASPALEHAVTGLCETPQPDPRAARRAAMSVARYALRITGRATPAGLLAGVAIAQFADHTQIRWGSEHHALAHADAGWLAEVIRTMERDRTILMRLHAVANSTLIRRGDRFIVPHQPRPGQRRTDPVDVSLRASSPVRAAVQAARSPIRLDELAELLHAAFPQAGSENIRGLLERLVAARVLVTSLHAPYTEPDALTHVIAELENTSETPPAVLSQLREIRDLLHDHRHAPAARARMIRAQAGTAMAQLAAAPSRHPVALDLSLDAEVTIARSVQREAERAADLLARLAPLPFGTSAWNRYFARFYERFGTGTLVPLTAMVAESGIGWPEDYPGGAPAPKPAFTARDQKLVSIAQAAALDGVRELVLDEQTLSDLEHEQAGSARWPAHLEMRVRVDAQGLGELAPGRFTLTVLSVSRGQGVLTGRFRHLLHPALQLGCEASLPTPEPDTLYAQLSFPPLDPDSAHVARSPQVLPLLVSLGEYRKPVPGEVLSVEDLAVGCDSERLYLAAPGLGVRVEAWALHALNLRRHTPPLARLITDLSRGQYVQVSAFDWGAARTLPFLPRLRHGRIVLASACWRLAATDLPGRDADDQKWGSALDAWVDRRRVPQHVALGDGDTDLPIDLAEAMDRAILREHLRTHTTASLTEAAPEGSDGWTGGRAAELVVPLALRQAAHWPKLPRPTPDRVVDPAVHVQQPGDGQMLMAVLYADAALQNSVLAELPELVAAWPANQWWFLRFRTQDGRDCMRLRVVLPGDDPASFADITGRIGHWAARLRRAGLLRDLAFETSYPQEGRWGSGAALLAAQEYFAADSRLVLTQLAWREAPDPRVLAAANFTAITAAFTGGAEPAQQWMRANLPARPPAPPVPRHVLADAVRLADPDELFAALAAQPGSEQLLRSLAERDAAIKACRVHYPGADTVGVGVGAVLGSLLHTHFLRAQGVDPAAKRTGLYLARAAALAADARRSQQP